MKYIISLPEADNVFYFFGGKVSHEECKEFIEYLKEEFTLYADSIDSIDITVKVE